MLPASHVYDRYSFLHISITTVIRTSMYVQDSSSLPPDLPHYWVNLYAFKHIILVDKLPVCNKSNCQMWGTKRHKVQQQHLTSEAKGLLGTSSLSTPHFLFFIVFLQNNSSNLCIWGSGPVKEWLKIEKNSLWQWWPYHFGSLAHIATFLCSTRLSLVFCVIEASQWSSSLRSQSLVPVVTWWLHHLFLGCLRECESLCCSFRTGLSDMLKMIHLMFHHSSRAFLNLL